MRPGLHIDTDKIVHNAANMLSLCKAADIRLTAVTKGCCAMPEVAAAFVEAEIDSLGDSRTENLEKLQAIEVDKLMLRIPMISEVEKVVRLADTSLNSQFETITALDRAAKRVGISHKVILMFDLGDLREGVYNDAELVVLAKKTAALKNISLEGIGTNLTCFGAVIPDQDNLGRLVDLAARVETATGESLNLISGGNSSSLYLLLEHRLPKGINHLRIGEAILCGNESSFFKAVPGMHDDCFTLVAELVEVYEKPSIPTGTIGKDAFRQTPCFIDRGIRKKAIAAVGKQDYAGHLITPMQRGIEVLGGSSDHLILDITESEEELKTGDPVSFKLSYGALLALATSPYVKKIFAGQQSQNF